MPSVAAAYTAPGRTAGASPGAALPTETCQTAVAVVVALNSGSGPGFFGPAPHIHEIDESDGGGIDGSHDDIVLQPASASVASRGASRSGRAIMGGRWWRGPASGLRRRRGLRGRWRGPAAWWQVRRPAGRLPRPGRPRVRRGPGPRRPWAPRQRPGRAAGGRAAQRVELHLDVDLVRALRVELARGRSGRRCAPRWAARRRRGCRRAGRHRRRRRPSACRASSVDSASSYGLLVELHLGQAEPRDVADLVVAAAVDHPLQLRLARRPCRPGRTACGRRPARRAARSRCRRSGRLSCATASLARARSPVRSAALTAPYSAEASSACFACHQRQPWKATTARQAAMTTAEMVLPQRLHHALRSSSLSCSSRS